MITQKMVIEENEEEVFIRQPSDLVPLLKEFYRSNSGVENFTVISLANSKRVISVRAISVGTVGKTLVHPREVYRFAVQENASAIIISHNHPMGAAFPSQEDMETTKHLINCGEIMGIHVLDHIIMGDRDYYSFLENGLCFKK